MPWHWTDACQAAFEGVKFALTHAPVLKLPELDKPFMVISDASVHGTGAVLLQEDRPIAYTSSKFSKAEYNYTTTDQECLGTVLALEEWRCYLEGAPQVTLVTDHQPLVYLQGQQSAQMLNRRQARWMEKLSRFKVDWEYRPGRINVADPISRMYEPAQSSKAVRDVVLAVLHASHSESSLFRRIINGYTTDPCLANAKKVAKLQLVNEDDVWYHSPSGSVYVPDDAGLRRELIAEFHGAKYSGHRGRDRTYKAIASLYWWPGLQTDVKSHIQSCDSCQRNKPSNVASGGQLQPLTWL